MITGGDSFLDGPEQTTSYWTTVNSGEAMPGVLTPLTASWYIDSCEMALRRTYHRLGVLTRSQLEVDQPIDQRFITVFQGHVAMNVDVWRSIADRMPGNSGDSIERQLFGAVRDGVESRTSASRYPVIACRMPITAATARRRVLRQRVLTERWWSTRLRQLQDSADPAPILSEAHRRFGEVLTAHVTCSTLTQAIYQFLCHYAAASGSPDLERSLVTGYGNFEETTAITQLWDIAHEAPGAGSVEGVVDRFGFIGPGELSAQSWRESPKALHDLVDKYRQLPADRSPVALEHKQHAERQEAERQVLASLPRTSRVAARLTMRAAKAHIPVREIGRANLLMAVDVGRAAARALGRTLTRSGTLERTDDVFMFTLGEIADVTGLPDPRALVGARAERRSFYESVRLPDTWTGVPAVATTAETSDSPQPRIGRTIRGIGINNSRVTGLARVVSDPLDADAFEEGEVLVCSTTDPSWASLFIMASAVVIDIGGPFSHGAIVARELGIPCVLNTLDGTRLISDGDHVEVNGRDGTVTVLATTCG